ncbi:MAG: preprotein translocase subunit SecY [Bacteroidota bacterium]
MKGLIETIRNIFKIPELRDRILYTILLLAVFRLGTFVILPGIDSTVLSEQFDSGGGGGLLDLFNVFLGGAFARGSILALGIMPYISASIVVQLLGAVMPSIQKLRAEGESGQKKMNQMTRYLTVAITIGQAAGYVIYVREQMRGALVVDANLLFWLTSVTLLTAGTMFLVWLGERITDNGIGNGVSLLIMIGIIAGFPAAIIQEASSRLPMIFFIEILALGVVTMAVVALTQATRKIPVNYARQMMGNRIGQLGKGNQARQYIPLKVNSAGVMPIIFAQAIMFLPTTLLGFVGMESSGLAQVLGDISGFWYNLIFFFLIIVFTYFYTAITVNPNEIADQLKRNGGFIPGIKPGKKTANYIDTVLSRITLPGSIFLAFVSIFPAIAMQFGASSGFAQFFGGTTLLIMIGVVLDTLQQIESYLLMRHYDGLMQTGRVNKGRRRSGMAV